MTEYSTQMWYFGGRGGFVWLECLEVENKAHLATYDHCFLIGTYVGILLLCFMVQQVKLIDWQTIKVLRTFENGAKFQENFSKKGINFHYKPEVIPKIVWIVIPNMSSIRKVNKGLFPYQFWRDNKQKIEWRFSKIFIYYPPKMKVFH